MTRFSYLSLFLMSGCVGLPTVMAGCAKKEQATVAGPVRVNVEVVGTSSSTSPSQNYSGTVEAANSSTVSFSVPGTRAWWLRFIPVQL